MMTTKPKTYLQGLSPLWGESFRAWFGWDGHWGQLMTNLIFLIGIPYIYLAIGEIEIAFENIRQLGFAALLGAGWICFVAFTSFVSANAKLHKHHTEKRIELGEFAENPFLVEIHKPDHRDRNEGPRRLFLDINNSFSNKKIENCVVRLDTIYDVKGGEPERIQQNLMWNAREVNQLQHLSIAGGGLSMCDVLIEQGPTTVYYLTWVSEKVKKYLEPGNYVLCFTVFGDFNGISKPHPHNCKLSVTQNYECTLSAMKEGEYDAHK